MGGGLDHRFIGTVSPGAPLLPHECARVCVSAAVPGSPTYPGCHSRKYTPNPETTEHVRKASRSSDWSEEPPLAPPRRSGPALLAAARCQSGRLNGVPSGWVEPSDTILSTGAGKETDGGGEWRQRPRKARWDVAGSAAVQAGVLFLAPPPHPLALLVGKLSWVERCNPRGKARHSFCTARLSDEISQSGSIKLREGDCLPRCESFTRVPLPSSQHTHTRVTHTHTHFCNRWCPEVD